ncbi:MAG: ABC transporter ATP-binding protein, partial [Chloroflexi bacterium]
MSSRAPAQAGRPGGMGGPGRMGMGLGPPAPKTRNVGKTLRRLLARLRPEWARIGIVAVLTSLAVAFSVIGPKIIGNATNVIFDGILGQRFPAGISKQQAVASLRAQGHGQIADLLSGANIIPGKGIDFSQLGRWLALAATVYILSALFSWLSAYIMAGVAQRTVYTMRADVEAKLSRLPLKYFDSHPHGDLLSRATNDIDNVTTTLQQGLAQMLNFGLTIIGVLALMVWISLLLAAVSLVMIPLSIAVTLLVARRSQKQFAAQWAQTGALNGHVEATHTGHQLVQVFGQRRQVVTEFHRQNQRLYEVSFRAQFLSGLIQPAITFLG